jgi:molybdate transport system substrate-binding protein
LTHLGIFPQIQRKALWADFDVREVRKAVESKEADVGITFLPEAKRSDMVKILATAPVNSYEPIITTLAVVKNSQHGAEAKALLDFLTSAKAMSVFEQYGFTAIASSLSSPQSLDQEPSS